MPTRQNCLQSTVSFVLPSNLQVIEEGQGYQSDNLIKGAV